MKQRLFIVFYEKITVILTNGKHMRAVLFYNHAPLFPPPAVYRPWYGNYLWFSKAKVWVFSPGMSDMTGGQSLVIFPGMGLSWDRWSPTSVTIYYWTTMGLRSTWNGILLHDWNERKYWMDGQVWVGSLEKCNESLIVRYVPTGALLWEWLRNSG